MKLLLSSLFLGIILQNSFADTLALNCQVNNPCSHKEEIGYCLNPEFEIGQGLVNGRYVAAAILSKRMDNFRREVFRVAATIPVFEDTSHEHHFIFGSSDNGENNIILYPTLTRSTVTSFKGILTLERDHEYTVDCVQ